jgi:hypothetical protein
VDGHVVEFDMIATVLAVLAVFLGTAVVGTVVTGLFWLTLVGIAGVLGTGAMGVSRIRMPTPDDAPPAAGRRDLRVITTELTTPSSRVARDDRSRTAA